MDALRELLSTTNLVDVIAFALIAICMLFGARRGLSGELAGTVSTVAGFVLGMIFYTPLVNWLLDNSRLGPQSASVVAFIVVFLVVFAIMLVIRISVKALLKVTIDKKTDRWGGAMAGMVKALVIVLAFFLIMIVSPSESMGRMFGSESLIGNILLKAIPELQDGGSDIEMGSDVMQLLDGE